MKSVALKLFTRQAKLQSETHEGTPVWEFLDAMSADRLSVTLHPHCPGDVYFDLEGSPFSSNEQGALSSREYLWGVSIGDATADVSQGCVTETQYGSYIAWWGHDDEGEEAAFTSFMRWLQLRLRQYPNLHVYHYGAYEVRHSLSYN